MSRIGRKPIVIPAGVEVKVDEADHAITVKGPKGTLHSKFHPLMTVKVEGNEILVTRPNDEKEARSLHGLTRTNIHNMVVGVTEGFPQGPGDPGRWLPLRKAGQQAGPDPGLLSPG